MDADVSPAEEAGETPRPIARKQGDLTAATIPSQ